jgi:regulator of Ty1 transposition protein 103
VYLANDVIQNSRKKGPEFGKTFAPIFKKVLEHMAKISGEKTKRSILRILGIWQERSIYDGKLIKEFTSLYQKAWNDLHDDVFDDDADAVGNSPKSPEEPEKPEKKRRHEGKDEHHHRRHSEGESSSEHKRKRVRTKKEEIDAALRKRSMEATNTIDELEADGVVQLEVKLSPSPYRDPPTEEELIQMIKDLEKMPSTDAATRGKIANLPAEVSDIGGIDEICIDSDIARSLLKKIQSAADLLHDYNVKLDKELDDRKAASMKLQDFLHAQTDLLSQAEHRLEEHQAHLKIMYKKVEDLKAHVSSMPDFSKLPTVTDGLAPLPSAGDLFNM